MFVSGTFGLVLALVNLLLIYAAGYFERSAPNLNDTALPPPPIPKRPVPKVKILENEPLRFSQTISTKKVITDKLPPGAVLYNPKTGITSVPDGDSNAVPDCYEKSIKYFQAVLDANQNDIIETNEFAQFIDIVSEMKGLHGSYSFIKFDLDTLMRYNTMFDEGEDGLYLDNALTQLHIESNIPRPTWCYSILMIAQEMIETRNCISNAVDILFDTLDSDEDGILNEAEFNWLWDRFKREEIPEKKIHKLGESDYFDMYLE